MRSARCKTLAIALLVLGLGARAQVEEIDAGYQPLGAAEEQRLRAILAEPVPQDALYATLRRHFLAKDEAAIRLFDMVAREAILRERLRLVPEPVARLSLGSMLVLRGEFPEGNALIDQAIDGAPSLDHKAFWTANAGLAMYRQFRDTDAQARIADAGRMLGQIERLAQTDDRRRIANRTRAVSAIARSLVEQRGGRPANAVSAALEATQFAERAIRSATGGITGPVHAINDYAYALRRQIEAHTAAGQFHAAEKVIPRYLALVREAGLGPGYTSSLYEAASGLRLSQREFRPAEMLLRKAEESLKRLGVPDLHPYRTDKVRAMTLALWAQRRYRDALLEFDRLDRLAGADALLRKRVAYPFERGLVYLQTGKHREAAALFETEATRNAGVHGSNHVLTAQASGLQGVALWRGGGSDDRARAISLLQDAVRDHMAAVNADPLEDAGVRREVRQLIFAAYLEAVASTPGADPARALGAADWVRGGVVQDAVADAAVRAAAAVPALAALVRQDQDARNEIIGLRKYLAGELGASPAALPVVASKVRGPASPSSKVRASACAPSSHRAFPTTSSWCVRRRPAQWTRHAICARTKHCCFSCPPNPRSMSGP